MRSVVPRLVILLVCAGACAGARPAARPAPVAVHARHPVDPRLSNGVVPFGDIALQLELGAWTVGEVDALLAEAHRRFGDDPNARLAFVMGHFMATPFEYESQLPLPPRGTLRVRLQSFGCTGFVIYMLALASARTFEELADHLRRIRYLDSDRRGVDSDPEHGNILDFAYNIFLESAAGQGFVRDVTDEVVGVRALTTFRTRFTARRRTVEYDAARRRVVPKLHANEVVAARMIATATFRTMDRSRIRTGDLLLFTRVDPRAPVGEQLLVGHLAIAVNVGGEIYMVHATRDYVWRPDATRDTKPMAAGRYYLHDPRREQLGVASATWWVDDPAGREVNIHGRPYHGYSPAGLRPVHDYLVGAHFHGVMVLRPLQQAGGSE